MFEEGHYSINELCERFSIDNQTFHRWKMKFEAGGREGLQETTSCKFYSKELKKVIWRDDSQVTELVARKWYSDNARAEVTIEW
ncbi:RusA family crossover junction endodeoxyribonuclease [Lysinibacillus sphaericus]|nr:RusA family crossover junction endodeoxyribonuclease [Lysinibacillus sphaericus]